jgi:MoxR-like ATPase
MKACHPLLPFKTMSNQKTAVIVDDETILFDGREQVGKEEIANALKSALESDPNFILVIGSRPTEHYKGIGTVIYASQRVGIPVENIRFTTETGQVVSLDELRAQASSSST